MEVFRCPECGGFVASDDLECYTCGLPIDEILNQRNRFFDPYQNCTNFKSKAVTEAEVLMLRDLAKVQDPESTFMLFVYELDNHNYSEAYKLLQTGVSQGFAPSEYWLGLEYYIGSEKFNIPQNFF